jgi:hypothetical protein
MSTVFLEKELDVIEQEIWKLLEEGVTSYKAPFHYATVATMQLCQPEVRTVILRNAERIAKQLSFHTDLRSPKVKQLQENPLLSWLFYHEPLRIQVRCYATASLHTADTIAAAAWEKCRLPSQLNYTPASSPGTVLPEPELIDLNQKEVGPAVLEFARENFCVVETKLTAMDWVYLHYQGNRRAYFDYQNQQFQWKQV